MLSTVHNFEVIHPMYIYAPERRPGFDGDYNLYEVDWVHVGVVEARNAHEAVAVAKVQFGHLPACANPIVKRWTGKPCKPFTRPGLVPPPPPRQNARSGPAERPQRHPR
jgi:hypothetical protein